MFITYITQLSSVLRVYDLYMIVKCITRLSLMLHDNHKYYMLITCITRLSSILHGPLKVLLERERSK